MIELYHGSLFDFSSVDVSYGKGYKDFGQGFYTTPSKKHADSVAKSNLDFERNRGSRISTMYRYNLLFDNEASSKDSDFRILEFKSANVEWLDFIIWNRTVNKSHGYDLVIGPTADAKTNFIIQNTLRNKQRNQYGQILTEEEKLELIHMLKPNVFAKQYCFCTNKAIQRGYLRFNQPQWRVMI